MNTTNIYTLKEETSAFRKAVEMTEGIRIVSEVEDTSAFNFTTFTIEYDYAFRLYFLGKQEAILKRKEEAFTSSLTHNKQEHTAQN